ncbi:MAG: hypothetical protein ACI9Q3_000388 [Maribacter sp.]|jgi:hypothetical protein
MNYDIHISIIGGITGKIIPFIISSQTASLPANSLLLWFARKYRKNTSIEN